MKTALERGIEKINEAAERSCDMLSVAGASYDVARHAKHILRETVAEAVKEEMQKLYEFVASSDRTIAPTCLSEEILDEIAKYLTNPTTEERG